MPHIAFSSQVSIPASVLVTEVGDETVLLNLQSERYFGLDEPSTRMWKGLTTGKSIQIAYEAFLNQFEVEAKVLKEDLQHWIEKLVDHGLVEINAA